MLPKRRTHSLLSIVLVCILLVLSVFPAYAQSDSSSDGSSAARTVFLPLVTTGGPLNANDAESVDSEEVSVAALDSFVDESAVADEGFTDTAPSFAASDDSEVSAAATDVVCLISGFSGNISAYSYAYKGAYSTTQCKYIDFQLASGSNVVWVRIQYYKGNKVKYSKWVYVNTLSVYSLLKNPKAGTVFYLQFYNPLSFTSYVRGAIRY